ncbi:Electron transfer flavoprotein subunit alpha [Azoarcus sp. Aa7]|nr:Electron transfer flavoprotein subunit alpha [Azoarcus sp. Aa7]
MSGILVVAEHRRGLLADISREAVAAAVEARAAIGGPVRVVVIGDEPARHVDGLNQPGVDEILTVTAGGSEFDAMLYEEAVMAVAAEIQPTLVLVGHSADGMALAPALAVGLGSGFASDVFGFGADEQGIYALRSGFNNKVNMSLRFPAKPVVVLTLRGQTWKPSSDTGSAMVKAFAAVPTPGYSHLEYIEPPASGVDIGKADFIFSIGRGIQDENNVPRFSGLADRIGATLGCSRPVADSGWLPKAHQVGLTGKVAGNCKLYIACGISGAVQHLHGMKHVETIIAVNTDPHAPIFKVASLGVVMDSLAFADALERQLQ